MRWVILAGSCVLVAAGAAGVGLGAPPSGEAGSPAAQPATGLAVAGVVESVRRPWSEEVVGAYAYAMPGSQDAFAYPEGAAMGSFMSGVGSIALPVVDRPSYQTQASTHFGVANLAEPEGQTGFVTYLYDSSRLVDFTCDLLGDGQLAYVDAQNWDYIQSGFVGSAIVSAQWWDQSVFDGTGHWVRNNLGLAAVSDHWAPQPPTTGDDAFAITGAPLMSTRGFGTWPWERPPTCMAGGPRGGAPPGEATRIPPTPIPYRAESSRVLLPAVSEIGGSDLCSAEIVILNEGDAPAKAVVLLWNSQTDCGGAGRPCPPPCDSCGPAGIVCTGLIAPGVSWHVGGADLAATSASAEVLSFDAEALAQAAPCTDPNGCACEFETLFGSILNDCAAYRRFQTAYASGTVFDGVDLGALVGPRLAAVSKRTCGIDEPRWVESYRGLTEPWLGAKGPDGQWTYELPMLAGPGAAVASSVRVQNASAECTAVEFWFAARGTCEAALCGAANVAPGTAYVFDLGGCEGDADSGSGYVRSATAPAAVVVDTWRAGAFVSYTGIPARFRMPDGSPVFGAESTVAVAPLVYARYEGWTSRLHLQNSGGLEALLRVTLSSPDGVAVADRQLGPLCPGGSMVLDLGEMAEVPGCWVGTARVEALPVESGPVATPWTGPEPTQPSECGRVPTPEPTVTDEPPLPERWTAFLPRALRQR